LNSSNVNVLLAGRNVIVARLATLVGEKKPSRGALFSLFTFDRKPCFFPLSNSPKYRILAVKRLFSDRFESKISNFLKNGWQGLVEVQPTGNVAAST
jgi:CRISPR/Cas system CMR-associated protein Cmr3 (group 5 of RAMP superfamily)